MENKAYINGKKQTLYSKFYNILQRCNNKNHPRYKDWGGRGIKCLWNNYSEFCRDMGESFKEHKKKYGLNQTTIGRIDNDGHYCKQNCRWETWAEQNNNRRVYTKNGGTKKLVIDGVERTMGDIRNIYKVDKKLINGLIYYRLDNGWNIKDAISVPPGLHPETMIEKDLSKLPKRESLIIELRRKGLTLRMIGKQLGITRERVRQIQRVAEERLKSY